MAPFRIGYDAGKSLSAGTLMNLNADFSRRAVMHGDAIDWVDSPMPGVSRKMLDRLGDEVARATSIVRYAPGSHFSAHTHGGGEEFLVLDGVFQDEHGDYPAGSYVRNPPQTSHTPGSEAGCTILVKLWQFAPSDRKQVRLFAPDVAAAQDAARPHVLLQPLHHDQRESVRIETWDPNQEVILDAAGGLEIFVLEGGFYESGEFFRHWSWLRLPQGARLRALSSEAGARLWVKEGGQANPGAPGAASDSAGSAP
jgi:quercetin dioxygenase-like cupin family protein